LRRTNSLLGVARSTHNIGDNSASQNTYKLLSEIWHGADLGDYIVEEALSATKLD
jgi:hypothetical protein